MRRLLAACLFLIAAGTAAAQDLQTLLRTHAEQFATPSRRSIGPALEALVDSGLPEVPGFLERFAAKEVWYRAADGQFYFVEGEDDEAVMIDISSGAEVGPGDEEDLDQIKPNAGVRRLIGTALVQFQLSDPDPARRLAAIDAIRRRPAADQLAPLLASIDGDPDPAIRARKERLASLLTARFGETTASRVAAIEALSGDISLDIRATLNQVLATTDGVAEQLPDGVNIHSIRVPGEDFSADEAYALLVEEGLAPARVSPRDLRAALEANLRDGRVGGVPVGRMGDPEMRMVAYLALEEAGQVAPFVTDDEIASIIGSHVFFTAYVEEDAAITDAAETTLSRIESRVRLMQAADLGLDALSLASIYFLAAIGLAITFGVMGVINMAHGEFIMMGAYTGYVTQTFIANHTVSILVAVPLAFVVTFAAGVAMERTVIRRLYDRPLETLLATFGISIALQQLAKNIFGTQARPLTAPGWLDGAWVINDVISISAIRIAIFGLALVFLGVFLYIMRRTRLGLETRAVTQNRSMAASMGINPERVNMLTFGLGSGIAGVAGVAIGLFAKVTSELGSDYIVQSFMTVVVGGVGNIWGTLTGAAMIGFFQKGVEWLNPSNTLAAQTYMIIFIIVFIQFRPRGIVALRGRAAGD